MLITTEQIREHLSIPASFKDARFLPYIPDAEEKYIKPYIGAELFDLLDTWQETKDEEESPELAALYPKVIPALARFVMLIAAPHLDLVLTDNGFGIVSGANILPASKERVARFEESTEKLAWDNIENLLRFLEENIADYPEWVESEAYTMQTENLINSAVKFNVFVNINSSRLAFHRMRKHISNVETMHVKPLISPALFDVLIGKIREAEELTDREAELLMHLQGFIANKVMAEDTNTNVDRPSIEERTGKVAADASYYDKIATFYYTSARELINTYPDDFEAYRDSEYYDAAVKPFSDYDNTLESSIFSAIP